MDRKLRTLRTSLLFLRKERSDRGARRLSNKVEKIIDAAIKKIYLTAERPDVAAVVEEVNLQCFNSKIKGKARSTRWVDAVEVRGSETEEVYLAFSPRFEHIWLE